jgi:hypothetical protein
MNLRELSMTEQRIEEQYTVEQASQHAIAWCKRHPAWRRICDIPDYSVFMQTYDDIRKDERAYWDTIGGEEAWKECGIRGSKVAVGFISGKGDFYDDVLKVPRFHNLMTVFRVGRKFSVSGNLCWPMG